MSVFFFFIWSFPCSSTAFCCLKSHETHAWMKIGWSVCFGDTLKRPPPRWSSETSSIVFDGETDDEGKEQEKDRRENKMELIIHTVSAATYFSDHSLTRHHTFALVKCFNCCSSSHHLLSSSSLLSSLSSSFVSSSSPPPPPPLPRLARGHRRPADQVQHVRQRHGQVGVHAPPRSGPEGADSAVRSAAGPWSRSHHEEPGGTDAAGLGNGAKGFSMKWQYH